MPDVTLKLALGSFSVEVTGPAKYAEQKLDELLDKYLGPSSRIGPATTQQAAARAGKARKPTSPAEFLRDLNMTRKNQTDRALALAYYLEKYDNLETFTTKELGALARKVKSPFGNVSDVVYKLSARGLMMSSGDKEGQRAYALTQTGEEYVEETLKQSAS